MKRRDFLKMFGGTLASLPFVKHGDELPEVPLKPDNPAPYRRLMPVKTASTAAFVHNPVVISFEDSVGSDRRRDD